MNWTKKTIWVLLGLSVHTVLFLLFPVLNVLLFERPERVKHAMEISYEIEVAVKEKEQKVQQKEIKNLPPSMNVSTPSPSRPSAFEMDLSLADASAGSGVVVGGGGGGMQVFDANEVDQKARALFQVSPDYPARAARDGVEGRVVLILVVERDGAVSNLELVSESPVGFGFADAAMQAMNQFRYKAAEIEGVSVRQRYTKEFLFEFE